MALDSGGRTIWEKVSTDRNVSDLTTKHHHEDRLAVFDVFGKTAICQRTQGRSLGGQRGPDRRGECGEENKESTIH